jgi:hypothetical protein
MTDNETAWAILERLEADGWSGRVNWGDTWFVVTLQKSTPDNVYVEVGAAGSLLDAVKKVESKVTI